MDEMHKRAEEARKKLESLSVDKVQYEAGKAMCLLQATSGQGV
ncbi:hypothetical protein [Paenibacillus sp. HW567]|nr:hypothetical protein [Paenibacillus sp. HW567]